MSIIEKSMDQTMLSILEEFECPVCLNYMLPPIRSCLEGHSFCDNCDRKLATCPFCRSPKTGARNYGMERIITNLTIPCKNFPTGCTIKLQGDQLRDHQKICQYKTMLCPLRTILNCSWKGRSTDIMKHCLENHPNNAFNTNRQHLMYPRFRNGDVEQPNHVGDSYHMIFQAHGELFKFVWDINPSNGFIRWCVIFLGPKTHADQYYFEVVFQNVERPAVDNPVFIRSGCQKVHPGSFTNTVYILSHINRLKQLTGTRGLYYTVSIGKYKEGDVLRQPEITESSKLSHNNFVVPQTALFFDMHNTDDVRTLFEFDDDAYDEVL